MSEVTQKIGFGSVNDTDESLVSKSGGKFGLNQGRLTVIKLNPLSGKDKTAGDAVDITLQVGDKEFRLKVYPVTGKLFGPGQVEVNEGDAAYNDLYNAEMTQRMAVVIHAIKAVGVTQEAIDAALASNPPTFAAWATILTSLLPPNYAELPIDGFLEYQWKIPEGKDRTFLQLPKNMKGGRFLCPSKNLIWTEVKDANGLHYVSGEIEHLFVRSANFMASHKAIQQKEGEPSGTGDAIDQANKAGASAW